MTPLDSHTQSNSISALAKSHIQGIGQWMRIVAIIYFVFLALAVLAIVGGLASLGFYSDLLAAQGISSGSLMGGGIAMLAFLALSFYVAWVMLKAANGFRSYATTGSPAMLEQGFVQNKTYWTILGVLTIIMLIFFVIALIAVASFLPAILSGAL